MKRLLLLLFIPFALLAQDAVPQPRLTEERVFARIGRLEIDLEIKDEYIKLLTAKIAALMAENTMLYGKLKELEADK